MIGDLVDIFMVSRVGPFGRSGGDGRTRGTRESFESPELSGAPESAENDQVHLFPLIRYTDPI